LRGSSRINKKLAIMPNDCNLEKLVKKLKIDEEKDLLRSKNELDYIFRKAFKDADTVWISKLAPGFSGAGVVMVKPDYNSVAGREVVLKFGIKDYIEKEEKNYNDYVKWFIGGMQCTTIMASAYSENIGGIVYSLIGHSLRPHEIYSFGKYYNDKTVCEIETAIEKLFEETCKYWYIKKTGRTGDLVELCIEELRLNFKELENSYKADFKKFYDDGLIQYEKISYSFKNPISWIASKKLERPLDLSFCITHGDFNKNNILLNDSGETWLIDFMRTGTSHILRDFIRLETTIKFELIEKNIREIPFYEFEKSLLETENLKDVPTFSDRKDEQDKLEKAFRVIQKIRSLAYPRANDAKIEYNIGLFLQTLKFLTWPEVNKKDFVLISASMICKKLEDTGLFDKKY
jgi:hypothetical protein